VKRAPKDRFLASREERFTIESRRADLLSPKAESAFLRTNAPTNLEPLRHVLIKMSCFFLYSALRRASLSAQAANTVYYLFELKSPHVTASAKFNGFRNRTDAEGLIRLGLGGVLDHVKIEEISESTAIKLKHGPSEQVNGGVLYSVDWADYRRMNSIWHRVLRMFLK